MHGFNLVLGSIMAFGWAERLVVGAQRLVTHFRASHRALALLRQAAAQFNIKQGLHSANKTRFTSKYLCTRSVEAHTAAFSFILTNHPDAITNPDVMTILEDVSFWRELPKLNKLLAPLDKVITAVQSNKTTLADVCR